MHIKPVISLAVAGLGVVLVIYALSSMHRISEAKGEVKSINSKISNTYLGKRVGGELSNKASQYDTEVMLLLIAGIGLVVVGWVGIYRYRKHRK